MAERRVGEPTVDDLRTAEAVVREGLAPTPLVAVPALGPRVLQKFETVQPTGSFNVRKNGGATDDHSTTGIKTRATANNQANRIVFYQPNNY